MNALVVYGSNRGSTREIAVAVGDTLGGSGVRAAVRSADSVLDLNGYDAVIVGGALSMGRWHPDARRFTQRFADELRARPVWLFSSGPLDHSADEREIPPVSSVAALIERVGARRHATFGGMLAPDAPGLVAGLMAKKMAGDYRNFDRIRAWAGEIAAALLGTTAAA